MTFLIATNNLKKLEELKRILLPLGIDAITAKEANVSLDDVEENGSTFLENSFIKAKAGCEVSGMPTIADDSGLCVDALNGMPGIYTARYGGKDITNKERITKLLCELDGVEDRKAYFACAISCVFPDGNKIQVEGKCDGTIAYAIDGDGGFGYDPIFLYDGVSFGKFSAEDKDKVSHRGNALRLLQVELKKYLEGNYANK